MFKINSQYYNDYAISILDDSITYQLEYLDNDDTEIFELLDNLINKHTNQ